MSIYLKKICIVITLLSMLPTLLFAQEHRTSSISYNGGELTFQYYEKDGVKVPDGQMTFTKGSYMEQGNNKDGFRDGEWTQTVQSKKGLLVEVISSYKNGLLEGKTIYKQKALDPKDYKTTITITNEYNFHQGHLVGENLIVNNKDSIRCNFDDKGNMIGTWEISGHDKTTILEFDPSNPDNNKAYRVDVLGQKESIDFNEGYHRFLIPIINWTAQFTTEPYSFPQKERVKLPTLSDNKYGICNQLKPIEEK